MKALLALEDGFTLEGESFTGPIELSEGTVIFNTAMSGYLEIITDPAYSGQIVCLTYPHIGNYGINTQDMESGKIHIAALVVKECCDNPSGWRAEDSLPRFMSQRGVPGVQGIDTRSLALHIRKYGSMRACISTVLEKEALIAKAKAFTPISAINPDRITAISNLYTWDKELARPKVVRLNADGSYNWSGPAGRRVLFYDFGTKWHLLRALTNRGFDLLVVPPAFTAQQVDKVSPDALFLSGGPGNPETFKPEIQELGILSKKYPIAGVALGYQLLGIALGGSITKLLFGHHGANHPVKDILNDIVFTTVQHHDYYLNIPSDLITTQIHLNDGTPEGFKHPSEPLMGIQYYPELNSYPVEFPSFWDNFEELIKKK